MFIYSLRASTLKFFGVICVALAALITLIVFIPTYGVGAQTVSVEKEINYKRIKDNDDRREFLSQFGWETGDAELEAADVTIPKEFDKIFTAYNEIQKRQGLDLAKYQGKNVKRYTYEVKNFDGYDGKVYANMLVYRNRVIGGDICTADVNGFIQGFEQEK